MRNLWSPIFNIPFSKTKKIWGKPLDLLRTIFFFFLQAMPTKLLLIKGLYISWLQARNWENYCTYNCIYLTIQYTNAKKITLNFFVRHKIFICGCYFSDTYRDTLYSGYEQKSNSFFFYFYGLLLTLIKASKLKSVNFTWHPV